MLSEVLFTSYAYVFAVETPTTPTSDEWPYATVIAAIGTTLLTVYAGLVKGQGAAAKRRFGYVAFGILGVAIVTLIALEFLGKEEKSAEPSAARPSRLQRKHRRNLRRLGGG